MIYFIKAKGSHHIKIGTATDVGARLKALQTAHPTALKIICLLDGSFQTEAGLHELFGHLRQSGEWFRLTDELRFFIRAIQHHPEDSNIYTLYRKSQQLRVREKALRLSKRGNRKLLDRIHQVKTGKMALAN